MPNVAAVTSKITDETARLFENNTVLVSQGQSPVRFGESARSGGKIGYDLKVRLPNRSRSFWRNFLRDRHRRPDHHDLEQCSEGCRLHHVDCRHDHVVRSRPGTLRQAAALTLAAQADKEGFDLYKKISRLTGTPERSLPARTARPT